jgi:hypothetical protein
VYDVHAALATQVVPSVVHLPAVTINPKQSKSVVAVLSVQTANLHELEDATQLHYPSDPAFPQAVYVR